MLLLQDILSKWYKCNGRAVFKRRSNLPSGRSQSSGCKKTRRFDRRRSSSRRPKVRPGIFPRPETSAGASVLLKFHFGALGQRFPFSCRWNNPKLLNNGRCSFAQVLQMTSYAQVWCILPSLQSGLSWLKLQGGVISWVKNSVFLKFAPQRGRRGEKRGITNFKTKHTLNLWPKKYLEQCILLSHCSITPCQFWEICWYPCQIWQASEH